MWRWLPSVLCNKSRFCVSERRLFFLQLCGLVFTAHLAIALLYGLVGWIVSGKERFAISLTQQGATYVLMPLHKKMQQHLSTQSTLRSDSRKKSNVIDHETYQRKKNARISKKVRQSITKSVVKSPTKIASKLAAQPIKERSSVMLASSSKSKKVISKSKQKLKKSSMKLHEVVQAEIVPVAQPVVQEVAPQEIVQPVVLQPVEKNVGQPEVVVQTPVPQNSAQEVEQSDEDDDFDENNVIFVGYEELDQSIIGSKIQHTIVQHWTPPVGMQKNISCEIRVSIGASGQAIDAKVMKESGVFVYDASARKTLINIEYPKEIWNKTITIALGA